MVPSSYVWWHLTVQRLICALIDSVSLHTDGISSRYIYSYINSFGLLNSLTTSYFGFPVAFSTLSSLNGEIMLASILCNCLSIHYDCIWRDRVGAKRNLNSLYTLQDHRIPVCIMCGAVVGFHKMLNVKDLKLWCSLATVKCDCRVAFGSTFAQLFNNEHALICMEKLIPLVVKGLSNSLTLLNVLTVMSVGFVMSFVVKLYFPCVMWNAFAMICFTFFCTKFVLSIEIYRLHQTWISLLEQSVSVNTSWLLCL